MSEPGLIEPSASQVTYAKYLKTDSLLSLQEPLTQPEEHDETLFIIIHQVYELWFKQLLHETSACMSFFKKRELMRVLAGFKRISAIQKVLVNQVDILETMTPDDFARFRERLNPASGFQSSQFRILEFTLGLKDKNYLRFFKNDPQALESLNRALEAPSLYDAFLKYLTTRNYGISEHDMEAAKAFPRKPVEGIVSVFKEIYMAPYENSDIYITLEALMDIDENLTLWRYRHVAMVKRMIGMGMGTGGSSGSAYLTTTLEKSSCPELWEVRNHIGK